MATAEKTVVYAVPMLTSSTTDAVLTTVGSVTVDLPESSKTFKSVYVELGYMDQISGTGGTVTESRLAVAIDAVGDSTATETDDLTHTGENISGLLQIDDFTSYFTTNYTSTSHSVTVKAYVDISTGTTLTANNVTAIIYITYTYDDTSSNQVETAFLPFDNNGSLATIETEIGTNQIPQLTGAGGLFDGLGTVTIKDWFIVAEGNSKNGGTTDITLNFKYDSSTTDTSGATESAMASANWHRYIWKPSDGVPDPTAAHAFKCWSSVSAMFTGMTFKLVVTYQWTPGTATRKFHSLQLPVGWDGIRGANGTQYAMRADRRIIIPSPGTITMFQSAVEVYCSSAAALTMQLKIGAQSSYRSYSLGAALMCGQSQFMQRIDSGAAAGAALTLSEGVQDLAMLAYPSSGTPGGLSGMLYLNFSSDLSSLGPGAHISTRRRLIQALDRLASTTFIAAHSQWEPAKWFLVGFGICLPRWESSGSNAQWLQTEYSTGSEPAYSLGSDAILSDTEIGFYQSLYQGRDAYKRWPDDPDAARRSIFDANQQIRVNSLTSIRSAAIAYLTTHSQYQSDSVAVTGYTGDGSGIAVKVRKVSDGSEVASLTTAAGGTASFDNYWEREALFTEVQQDSTHVGRSANRTAV